MKALVYVGTQRSEIRDLPEPAPAAGMAIVRVSHCGICGSDMHAWHGLDERRIPPLVLGHEAAGIAETGRHAGMRVAINPLMTCGQCPACVSGNEHLCGRRELIGMRLAGAFAEKVAIAERNLVAIPDDLSFESAALAEPLAVAVHAVEVAKKALRQPLPGAHAAILGGGAIGLLCALVLQHDRVASLSVAETNVRRQAALKTCIAADIYDPRHDQGPAAGSADLVIDAVGSGATRKAASELAAPGGAIIHVGLQDNAEGLDTRRLTLQEISFAGTYCYTNHDFRRALDLLGSGVIAGTGWSQVRRLDDGAQSFIDIHNANAPPKIILQCA